MAMDMKTNSAELFKLRYQQRQQQTPVPESIPRGSYKLGGKIVPNDEVRKVLTDLIANLSMGKSSARIGKARAFFDEAGELRPADVEVINLALDGIKRTYPDPSGETKIYLSTNTKRLANYLYNPKRGMIVRALTYDELITLKEKYSKNGVVKIKRPRFPELVGALERQTYVETALPDLERILGELP